MDELKTKDQEDLQSILGVGVRAGSWGLGCGVAEARRRVPGGRAVILPLGSTHLSYWGWWQSTAVDLCGTLLLVIEIS